MSTAVKMPQLGESVVEGAIVRWLKAPGEQVAKYEPLLEISTDKIDTEVPSPAEGILLEILAQAGQLVTVGTVLATIGQRNEKPMPVAPTAASIIQSPSRQGTRSAEPSASVVGPLTSKPRLGALPPKPTGRAFISPVVARIADQHQIDLEQITGSGLGGRITKKDILAFVDTKAPASASATDQLTSQLNDQPSVDADQMLQPLSAMRRAIAQHMVLSKQTSPHVTTVFEVDMTAVVRHREANKPHFAERGISLTFTPYFVAAVARALREVPAANSRFTPEGLLFNRRIHLGLAVSLPDGLLVPVLRDADEKNLAGLARAVNDLAERARAGKLAPDEVKGGTFTITNHGISGSLMGTPIINQPQTGILGIGAITKRAVVRTSGPSLLPSAEDALVIRPMCYLSFSFDHRVLDGAKADLFLSHIRLHLEDWQND